MEKQDEKNLKQLFVPRIYAYTEPQYKNQKWEYRKGTGLVKVGYTTKSAHERIDEQFPTKKPTENPYEILLDEIAIRNDGSYFTDHDVHKVLEKVAYRFKKSEWFECTLDEIKRAISAVKERKVEMSKRDNNFKMRPEQKRAVEMTAEYFKKYSYEKEGKPPHFLWNAKMRFGKTFTSYQLAKRMNWKRVLVLTFKPAVQDSWQQDLEHHEDFKDWQFVSREGLQYKDIDKNNPVVWFASFQDVLQTDKNGCIKSRNEEIHCIPWDCIILDEYHFGAWRESAKDLYDAEENEENKKSKNTEDKNEIKELEKESGIDVLNHYDEEMMPLTTNAYLYLSGTPFRALNNGEFLEDQIFNWTYSDEQKAKENWDDKDGANPYAELPRMVMMTYQMPKEIQAQALLGEFNQFDLNEFFKASFENGNYRFEHEADVVKWLNLICGRYTQQSLAELKTGSKPPFPFTDIRLLNALKHTFWFLPSVASCKAMGKLLKEHPFYQAYSIIVCAGNEAGIGAEALTPVKDAIKMGFETKTITLSCGKLTTGVTVPEWGGIFMLRNTSSPETYFQSAFRVQSPWTLKNPSGLNPNEKEVVKPICYVFDFAPDRALKQIADYSARLNVNSEENPEQKVQEFISYLPVLCFDGSKMEEISANDLLDLVVAGTASSMLARRWETALLVNVDNETLKRLLESKEAIDALEKIEGFRNLKKEVAALVNKSEGVKKTKKEGNLTEKQKKELTAEQKEIISKRKEIQEKLLKFATRIPVFMYLTDDREQTLKDVIEQLEPDLFKKVTGLTIKDFGLLVSLGIFNDQKMNEAVFAFKRYEDASLEYTGISMHKGDKQVGGFDTKISSNEYINMTN